MKYLLISIEIQHGEYRFMERCLCETEQSDLGNAAREYAKDFYCDTEYDEDDDLYIVNGWELAYRITSYSEISKEVYDMLEQLFYS